MMMDMDMTQTDRTGGLPTSPDIMTRHIHTGSGVTPTETTGETI